jgi:hypothetical protein
MAGFSTTKRGDQTSNNHADRSAPKNGDLWMSGARLSFGVVAATFVILGAAVARADELPPGPNREVVARECQACHDANYFESTNRSRESWDSLIDEMISYGMRITPEERAKILDYLATALGPRPN